MSGKGGVEDVGKRGVADIGKRGATDVGNRSVPDAGRIGALLANAGNMRISVIGGATKGCREYEGVMDVGKTGASRVSGIRALLMSGNGSVTDVGKIKVLGVSEIQGSLWSQECRGVTGVGE